MTIVVPSQVVEYIDRALTPRLNSQSRKFLLFPAECGSLNALLRMIEKLPNALLPAKPDVYAGFLEAAELIRYAVSKSQSQDHVSNMRLGPPELDGYSVQVIREALSTCADECPPLQSTALSFIKDPGVRTGLQIDLEAVRSALSHGEWKAATVLAGSLVEALLLWAVQQPPAHYQSAVVALIQSGTFRKKPPNDPLEWVLHQFVEVADNLRLIESETAKQARLAKDFRNLIHPGRAIAKQQSCDRGTALAASAAVELVSRDLQVRFP